jgi:hypothetical protein
LYYVGIYWEALINMDTSELKQTIIYALEQAEIYHKYSKDTREIKEVQAQIIIKFLQTNGLLNDKEIY